MLCGISWADALDSSSPVSPGVRPYWLDPVEAQREPCPSGRAGAAPPRDPVLRRAGPVVVRFDAPPEATVLAVALRPTGSDEPAVTRAFALDATTGEVELPPSREFDVWTSVVGPEGVASAGAKARASPCCACPPRSR